MSADWVKRDVASVWHGFTQMAAYEDNSPVIAESAEGHYITDVDGRQYLDAISSLWVTTLGHRVPELDAALADQAGRVAHTTMLGNGNRVVIEFAEELNARLPMEDPRLLFAADGAVAVEQAVKIAFQYWQNLGVTDRTRYLALGGAYHGDTIGSMSVGDGGFGTDQFDPLTFTALRAPGYDDPAAIDTAIAMVEQHAGELAAVVIEPIVQGAVGIQTRDPGEFGPLADACREAGALLVCDEVAVGFGRTGALFASELCGIRPDLMALGKGITGGYLPMAATAAADHVWKAFGGVDLGERTFYHGHSYGGNALAAAVALEHLRIIERDDVLANVRERAAQFESLLAEAVAPLPQVGEVRQQGLMIGIQMAPPERAADGSEGGHLLRWGRRVSAACTRRGVLIRPLGDVVVVVPHLTTTAEEVERIVGVLAEAIREAATDEPQPQPGAGAELDLDAIEALRRSH